MKRNPKYRNSFLKDEISNVSRTPFAVTSAPRTLAIILTFIKTAGNTNNSNLAPAPVAVLIFVPPLLLPLPSNLPFSCLPPPFLGLRSDSPRRVVGAKGGTGSPRRRCAKGVRGARRPCRGSKRSAPSPPLPPAPPPPERGERASHAVPRADGAKQVRCLRRCRRRRAAGVLPSPLPRPLCNAVTPVVRRPMIVLRNQPGRGADGKGNKG